MGGLGQGLIHNLIWGWHHLGPWSTMGQPWMVNHGRPWSTTFCQAVMGQALGTPFPGPGWTPWDPWALMGQALMGQTWGAPFPWPEWAHWTPWAIMGQVHMGQALGGPFPRLQ